MRRDRVCVNLPDCTTIEEKGGHILWTKIREDLWHDGERWTKTDREMDDVLIAGGQVIIVDKGLTVQEITAYDLEEGDYILTRWDFWWEVDAPMFDPNGSQWLWRCAGWRNNDAGHATVILDAPEGILAMKGHGEHGEPVGYEVDPILWPVTPATIVHYVDPGQKHERWDDRWDWAMEYDIVSPPAVHS